METKPTKYYSSKQEKQIAAALNWNLVSGSGNRIGHPGDVKGIRWLCECKTHTTVSDKIQFSNAAWKKLQTEAMSSFRVPAMFVDNGSQDLKHTWVIFPYLLVDPRNLILKPISVPVKVNLSFSDSDLQAMYVKSFKRYYTKLGLFSLQFGGVECGLVPFDYFKREFGDA